MLPQEFHKDMGCYLSSRLKGPKLKFFSRLISRFKSPIIINRAFSQNLVMEEKIQEYLKKQPFDVVKSNPKKSKVKTKKLLGFIEIRTIEEESHEYKVKREEIEALIEKQRVEERLKKELSEEISFSFPQFDNSNSSYKIRIIKPQRNNYNIKVIKREPITFEIDKD